MSERIDDLEKTVCKLVEESNVNDANINNLNNEKKAISKNFDNNDN
jgi:hypothetical protein